jgi:hypothetical protein
MAGFNPDEYLASTSQPQSAFNPDAYLGVKPQPAQQKASQNYLSLLKSGVMDLGDIGRGMIGESAKFVGRVIPGVTGEELQSSVESRLAPRQVADNRMITSKDLASVGRGATDIGAAFAIPSAIGSVASKIPQAAKYAELLSSGGFNMGNAATKSKLANALMRGGVGAVEGYGIGVLDNPESADTAAMVQGGLSSALPVAAQASRRGAEILMQSAIKPTLKQLESGQAKTAVDTLLELGINPTNAGVETLKSRISGINQKIADALTSSNAIVNKEKVLQRLGDVESKFANQVAPTSDVNAIRNIGEEFMASNRPMIEMPQQNIPVQLAQKLKQGTYKVLSGKYGEAGSASTEAQKALARGLKEEIASEVPAIAGLNAEESKLITTLKVAERRALMEMNKNPAGLALLASDPKSALAFMADKSAAFKSLAARMINQAGKANAPVSTLPALAVSQGEQ